MKDPNFSKFIYTTSNNLVDYDTSLLEQENKINFSPQETSKIYNQYPIINGTYNIDINNLNNNYITYNNINNDINKINLENLIQESSIIIQVQKIIIIFLMKLIILLIL